MRKPVERETVAQAVGDVLTQDEPFGPPDSGEIFARSEAAGFELTDRSNKIFERAAKQRPVYVVGRKGAGKTAFLKSSLHDAQIPHIALITANVYSKYAGFIRRFEERHAPLFADQRADIWMALFTHVTIYHTSVTARDDDDVGDTQLLWYYVHGGSSVESDAMGAVENTLSQMKDLSDKLPPGADVSDLLVRLRNGGHSYVQAKAALHRVLERRDHKVVILMDNLEDLHKRLSDVAPALQGLFRCVGRLSEQNTSADFEIQICLPSELFDDIQALSAGVEKDFRKVLPIYWSAREILHLAASRLSKHLEAHHPKELESLQRNAQRDYRSADGALLRAALPRQVINGLNIPEDPIAYLLRHTQLVPRHAVELLNAVFVPHADGSQPWAVTEKAVLAGTRAAESKLVAGILNAYSGNYPEIRSAIKPLANRLPIRFGANQLRQVFNREGVKKITGMEYHEFVQMLFTVGVVGVFTQETERYYEASFQYTFATPLSAVEGEDDMCFHPLFTRRLHSQTLPKLRSNKSKVTYPYGSNPDKDYRDDLGYINIGTNGGR
jgi:hypothetical protein